MEEPILLMAQQVHMKKSLANANQIFTNIKSEFKNLKDRYNLLPSQLNLIGAPQIKD